MADLVADITARITPPVEDMGFELVRVLLTTATRPTLQIMAERKDRSGMTVDDCAALSRAISAMLDVEDPIHGTYTLEVSSPGLDRPLTRRADFDRFAGFDAKVELATTLDGQRRFSGVLKGLKDDAILLEVDGEIKALPFVDMRKAKLLLTDALIASAKTEEEGTTGT
ncbi:MAG: ribosome maturation factor RimP [Magnetospiraceae bacterium]